MAIFRIFATMNRLINSNRKLLWAMLLVWVLTGCGKPGLHKPSKADNPFTPEVVLKTTPVKDQGRSELCWVYAMLATIETEHLMMGDSVNLSPDYMARMYLRDEAQRYYLGEGRQPLSLRGMASMTLRLMERYGVLAYDAYHNYEGVDYNVLKRKAEMTARGAATLSQMNERLDDLLDRTVGYMPRYVFMLGAEYTTLEFAHSVCRPGEYLQLTSFTHHPFGQEFVPELPDNRMLDSYQNVPLDTMMNMIVRALRSGHPVCWEGDISEKGFDFARGVAVLQHEDRKASQQQRQQSFETRRTTDDHCMMLCGIAHDSKGRRYFLAKNSWGTDNRYKGFMYLSENYVRMKTIAVLISRNALPAMGQGTRALQ
jgi:bleomycin hydrolase